MSDQEWISVEDRLPEDRIDVLVCMNGGKEVAVITGVAFIGDNGNWFDYHNFQLRSITHWQPLPEPPEVQS